MDRPFRFIEIDQRDEVCLVELVQSRLTETEIHELASELLDLAHHFTHIALALGPRAPECLYSVFLAKLVQVQRTLARKDGSLILCAASEEVQSIFSSCRLDRHFRFAGDFDAALLIARGEPVS